MFFLNSHYGSINPTYNLVTKITELALVIDFVVCRNNAFCFSRFVILIEQNKRENSISWAVNQSEYRKCVQNITCLFKFDVLIFILIYHSRMRLKQTGKVPHNDVKYIWQVYFSEQTHFARTLTYSNFFHFW